MAIQQNFPSSRPSLSLNFARSKKLDPRITFTRTSSATYVGEDGLIKIAPANEARFDHDPITGDSLGLLIEESRSNLVLNSATFQPSSGATPASYTVDQVSPDGTITASRQTEIDPRTFRDYTGIANNTYTFSVYIKVISGSEVFSILLKNANSDTTISNVSGLTATTEWQRFSITGTTTGATTGARIEIRGSVNGAPAGMVFWGAQLEVGAFPTSYIPTTASTVTRTADNASMTGSNFSSWFNPNEGSISVVVSRPPSLEDTRYILSIDRGSFADGFFISKQLNSQSTARIRVDNGDTFGNVGDGVSWQGGISRRLAFGYSLASSRFVSQGNLVSVSNQTVTSFPNVNKLNIGSLVGTSFIINGTISQLTYYPSRLTNTQIQTLTK
jgi:hypothetical protein